jgi:hypothetical protein
MPEPRREHPDVHEHEDTAEDHTLAEASVERASRHNIDRTTRREALELGLLDDDASHVGSAIPDAGDPEAVDHDLIEEIDDRADEGAEADEGTAGPAGRRARPS